MMKVKLPGAQFKVYLDFLDEEKNVVAKIEKVPKTNRDGDVVVRLKPGDVPPESKYVQLVAEIEGQAIKSGLSSVSVQETFLSSEKDQGPQFTDTSQESLDFGQAIINLLEARKKLFLWEKENKALEDEATRIAAYESMTYEERLKAVHEKWATDKLPLTAMTEQELLDWRAENARQGEQLDNFLWNHENHAVFLKGIKKLYEYLTDKEKQTIKELLEAKKWGNEELERVKEIIETAQWFNKMESRL
ncbi:MAG: hypothetical protein HS126_40575 [Anaerolineales bacterium]|nr:hypothetical protein [Anaerolineales bacterium]